MKLRALIILHPGIEEMEAVAPIDLLSRAGVEVVQASIGKEKQITGRSGITLQANCLLSEIEGSFDITILPGGPGIMELRNNPQICQSLKQQFEQGGIVACICAAPLLLKDSGLLYNVRYTAHPTTAGELDQASHEAVVCDGQIITSRGAGTATEFALSIVDKLCGSETANETAASICWTHSFM